MGSLPEELEDRFSECHDLPIKRAVTSTGNENTSSVKIPSSDLVLVAILS